ncbi:MAG: S9 family peptidase, partial [Methylocystis sp.]
MAGETATKTSDWRIDFAGAQPPVATPRHTRRVIHGRVLDDPYEWLAAKIWREVLRDPETLPDDIAALVKAENTHCDRVMA